MSRRIAIAVDKEGDIAHMSPRFGVSHTFLIVDADTGETIGETANNPEFPPHPQGTKEALSLKSKNIDGVISNDYGSWAYAMLDDQNIETLLVDRDTSPADAIALFRFGILRRHHRVTI